MTSGQEWSGRVGDSWADEWRRTDRSFAELSVRLNAAILAAAPETGLAVDIGCGAGGTAIALATARPDLDVLGIDISAQLVVAARERGAAISNLRFEAGDAVALGLQDVDLFCSRHGVMFFDDPVAAFAAFRRAASPSAALVFSCFREAALNPWAAGTASAISGKAPPSSGIAPGPFAFADPAHVAAILAASGWSGTPEPVDYVYHAGAGDDPVADAVGFFARIGPAARELAMLDAEARPAALERLRDYLSQYRRDGVVDLPAAAWIWSCRPAAGQGDAR